MSFTFVVYLITDNKYQNIALHQNKIIKWYQDVANEYNFSDMKLTYIGNNIFEGNYCLNPESDLKLDLEIFVDPDDDGSHPYIPGSYIIGKLQTINGHNV
jgi:hypothetical protein